MFHTVRNFFCFALLLIISFTSIHTTAVGAQTNRPQDKEIRQTIRFARGATSTVLRKQIKLGTSHVYTLRAREGQVLTVSLKTGNKTSMSIYAPTSGIIEEADGIKRWTGTLSESGEYTIVVGTDATANYTLNVSIS